MHSTSTALFILGFSLTAPLRAEGDTTSRPLDEIIITSPIQRSQKDALQSSTLLSGEALAREVRGTLGETLARQPGVSSTSFGPGASRPVLRGFQGERIRVLIDGIGSIDVSNTSPDHAVAAEPLTAERIEILRGPTTLLFGSSAIGGVVNQIDNRIANGPLETLNVRGVATYGTAAKEKSISGAFNLPIGANLILHADGNFRDSKNLKIGGFARSEALRDLDGGTTEEDTATRGTLLNSFTQSKGGAVGLTAVFDESFIGASVSLIKSKYGIPGPEAEFNDVTKFEGPRIDLRQVRGDVKGRLALDGGFFEKINLRGGYANYRHFELEPSGDIGTTFRNKAWEARVEAVQRKQGQWAGASGIQVFNRDFSAIGDEAFLPQNNTRAIGLFTVQEYQLGKLKLEGGLRYENTSLKVDSLALRRKFNTFSGSIGGLYSVNDTTKIGLSLQRTARAPAAEELFANGPHAATRAFEIGNPDFKAETALGGDLSFHIDFDRGHIIASLFYSRFNNFIFEDATGETIDDLAVFQFRSARAQYYGAEVEAEVVIYEKEGTKFSMNFVGDLVQAKNLDTNTPLPRIPAARALIAAQVNHDYFDARAEVEFVAEQKRIAAFELPSRGYQVINLSTTLRPFGKERDISLDLQANNILNADARRHASFLKDFAPLAGRDFRITLRAGF
jgi:iron complex outermembrane recepter protein